MNRIQSFKFHSFNQAGIIGINNEGMGVLIARDGVDVLSFAEGGFPDVIDVSVRTRTDKYVGEHVRIIVDETMNRVVVRETDDQPQPENEMTVENITKACHGYQQDRDNTQLTEIVFHQLNKLFVDECPDQESPFEIQNHDIVFEFNDDHYLLNIYVEDHRDLMTIGLIQKKENWHYKLLGRDDSKHEYRKCFQVCQKLIDILAGYETMPGDRESLYL